jgi:hypothetical protein
MSVARRMGRIGRALRRAGESGIGHAGQLPRKARSQARRGLEPEERSGGTEPIRLFYDFRALMRSETSR